MITVGESFLESYQIQGINLHLQKCKKHHTWTIETVKKVKITMVISLILMMKQAFWMNCGLQETTFSSLQIQLKRHLCPQKAAERIRNPLLSRYQQFPH